MAGNVDQAGGGDEGWLTRDPVAEITTLDGYPYEIVDTAGEGPAESRIDARALAKARAARVDAITMLVVDRAIGPSDVDRALARGAALVVANKCDLQAAAWPADIPRHLSVSCVRDEPGSIRQRIGRQLREHRGLPAGGPVGGVAALSRDELRRLEECAARIPR